MGQISLHDLRFGFNHKKNPNLYRMEILTCFVNPEVEKSNFYRDLEGVDSDKKIQKQNEIKSEKQNEIKGEKQNENEERETE